MAPSILRPARLGSTSFEGYASGMVSQDVAPAQRERVQS